MSGTITPPPDSRQPVVDATGHATLPWYRWFTSLVGQALSTVVHTITTTGSVTVAGTTTTPVIGLAASGVTAGTYGDATHVARVTVNTEGLVTAASNVAISGGGGGSCWIPLSLGVEQDYSAYLTTGPAPWPQTLVFVSDGAGQPILVAYP
jgi:hypothetical protein